MPENLALRAKASATSEHNRDYRAAFAIDGVIPAAKRGSNAIGHEWATKGAQRADFVLSWQQPVEVQEIVYYGRTTFAVECFKDYTVHLDDATRPVTKGKLRPGHGPQRIRLPKRTSARRLTLRFLNSHGAHNPGAAEVRVYSRSPAKAALGVFVPMPPMNYRPAAPRGKDAPVQLAAAAKTLATHGVREVIYAERPGHSSWTGYGAGGEGHWYSNFGYYAWDFNTKTFREGGALCRFDLKTGKRTVLVADAGGTIRDPVVHYDAKKVLFSYRKSGEHHFHLYEIDVDTTEPRQLTTGKYDDIEPTYLPDGGIMFVSGRGKRWVNCWVVQVATLHRCDADGRNIRLISANIEQDNTPCVLPDGRILFQRWEYVDRSQVNYHHLWTTNPDGTGQAVFFGNMHPGGVFIDAQPVPGTDKVVFINSPGHGSPEHAGAVAILDNPRNPDDRSAMRNISGRGYRDPWPLTPDCIIAATGPNLVVMNGAGEAQVFFRGGMNVHEPRPLIRRKREHVIPPRVDLDRTTGKLILSDVYKGRNMAGVEKGEIKKLLILESLPKPINYTGGMAPMSCNGTFTMERVLGTVPVEPDGSAAMEVPANRALILIALDENNSAVKRMQSFLSVAPGETRSCIGCHEQRHETVYSNRTALLATKRAPSVPQGLPGIPDILDFPRDIQPVLDRHCVRCHNPDQPDGGVQLTGDHGPIWSHSFYTLTARKQFVDGRNRAQSNYAPRTFGDAASPLMKKIDGGHYEVTVSDHERELIRTWINVGAPYPGTYAALGTGMIGGYEHNICQHNDTVYPEVQAMAKVLKKRCAGCHSANSNRIPYFASEETQNPTWVPIRNRRFQRHLLYNLSRPEKSRLLMAPLAANSGGYAVANGAEKTARRRGCDVVFADKDDADYAVILRGIEKTRWLLSGIKRFDMPGFQPRKSYLREMLRYGLLPADFDPSKQAIDVYALDRRYFRSLWYYPPGTSPALHQTGLPCAAMQTDRPTPYAPRRSPSKR